MLSALQRQMAGIQPTSTSRASCLATMAGSSRRKIAPVDCVSAAAGTSERYSKASRTVLICRSKREGHFNFAWLCVTATLQKLDRLDSLSKFRICAKADWRFRELSRELSPDRREIRKQLRPARLCDSSNRAR